MAKTEALIVRTRNHGALARVVEELRSFTLGPYNTKDATLARLFGGSSVSAGVPVNETSAMNYSAVWAAVGLISGDIARVPLMLYKRTADGRGKDRYANHALYRILHDRPNPEMGSMVFRRTLQAHALVWGNGYAEIERDVSGRPAALWPLLPYAVETFLDGGRLQYRVYNPTRTPTIFDPRDILHIRGLMMDDGRVGLPCIGSARESVGLGIAAERFGATFFGNGSTFGGIVSYPDTISPSEQVRKENRDVLDKRHQGVDRAHRILALYGGAKYESLGVPPNAAQFLETREFQIEEVCRWFNLPPHKLKHLKRSTNNNIEHQGIEYKTDTLDPWWSLWEEELTLKLISPLELQSQVIEHVREGLMQGDQAARGEFYSKRFSVASITPNEIRANENANPLPGGDRAFVPLNLIPMDRLDEWLDAEIASKKAKADPPSPPPNLDGDPQRAALEEQLALARHAAQTAEDAADFAKTELQRERDLHAATRTQADTDTAALIAAHDERVTALEDQVARAAEARAVADQQIVTLTEERDALSTLADDLRLDVQTSRQQTTEADEARAQEVAARQRAEADRDAALVLATQAEQDRDAHRQAIEQLQAEIHSERERRVAAQEAIIHTWEPKCDTAEAARVQAEADRDTALARAAEIEQERDAARAEVVTATAGHAGLRAGWNAEREAREAKEMLLDRERDAHEQAKGDAEILKTDLARARADLATEIDRQRIQRGTLLASMRGLFVDTTARLLQREIDRARKHQTTPDKFRAWVQNFYGLHADVCRDAFRPLVEPWTAVTGGNAGDLLERLVTEHLETSRAALGHVLDADDSEAMIAALDRTLRRWESERADQVADALLREGMAGHG